MGPSKCEWPMLKQKVHLGDLELSREWGSRWEWGEDWYS